MYCRYCFPFGRPEGALKATLSLLERVLMKDIVTPVPPEEVRSMIKKCLETAALVNYTRLSSEAKLDGEYTRDHNYSIAYFKNILLSNGVPASCFISSYILSNISVNCTSLYRSFVLPYFWISINR